MYWIQIVGKSRDIIDIVNIVPADGSAACTATYNIDYVLRARHQFCALLNQKVAQS
jgi:hypothetical protein